MESAFSKVKTLSERLNFSLKKEHFSAINGMMSHTLKLCVNTDNDINVMMYSAKEFENAVDKLKTFGRYNKSIEHYYFWIGE